jgi:bifunctional non-homologous end joining protein LigD
MTGYHRATMTDQLSLRLEPERPVLPALPDLRPMLPRPLAESFDSDEHLFQPWWGGRRALVYVGPAETPGGGVVRIADEDGLDITRHLRELAGLAVRVDARSAVLDGELVVVDSSGRADATAMEARLEGRAGRAVAFLALDVLHLDGRSLLNQPLAKRHEALRRVLRPGDEVVAVPAIPSEGRALWDAVVAQGVAGVLARQHASPYLPGIRSRLWRFIAAVPAAPVETEQPPEDEAAPLPAAAPVLALIERLPLDLGD